MDTSHHVIFTSYHLLTKVIPWPILGFRNVCTSGSMVYPHECKCGEALNAVCGHVSREFWTLDMQNGVGGLQVKTPLWSHWKQEQGSPVRKRKGRRKPRLSGHQKNLIRKNWLWSLPPLLLVLGQYLRSRERSSDWTFLGLLTAPNWTR